MLGAETRAGARAGAYDYLGHDEYMTADDMNAHVEKDLNYHRYIMPKIKIKMFQIELD